MLPKGLVVVVAAEVVQVLGIVLLDSATIIIIIVALVFGDLFYTRCRTSAGAGLLVSS